LIYFDTSALTKRFVSEKGSPLVQTVVGRNETVATAKIAYAEIIAGLTRKLSEGNLSRAQYGLACRQFERDWQAYLRAELQDSILLLARDLIQRRPPDRLRCRSSCLSPQFEDIASRRDHVRCRRRALASSSGG